MASLYLSPSTQEYNKYYENSGSEEYYMNLIADAMEPYLLASGISFTRNSPDMTVNEVVRQSNEGNYGLHLAIHSNAGPESLAGLLSGSDVYYYAPSKQSLRAATIFADGLREIYYDPSAVREMPNTTFAELRYTDAPAVLVELAYHDNPEDAEWIKNNIRLIARNLSQSAAEFLGVEFVDPQVRTGVVHTQGGRLNIRNEPSLNGDIIGQIPNGATVEVLARSGEWYSVSYQGITGYSFASYITVS